ncbi:MAG TPA: hypothetical protein VFB20_16880 [Burkholderiales bacterium]|nr:hypothetical protein [Burkholderiales bacterium]
MDHQTEQTLVQNGFGTVTDRRVIYFQSKGWIRGGSGEEIPLQFVTSVRLDISRHLLVASLVLAFGFAFVGLGDEAEFLGLILIAYAGLLIWGSPMVVVTMVGRDLNAAIGLSWKRGEASAFVGQLRTRLFGHKPPAD